MSLKCFEQKKIHAALFQRSSLFLENGDDILVRQFADVLEDSERSDGAGNQNFLLGGFARFAGNFYGAMIQFGNAIGHAEFAELVTIGAEGIGFNDLGAGFDVGLMDAKHGVAVGDVELVHAALRADGFIEQRAHGAVGDQDGVGESFVEIFDAHGLVLFATSVSPPNQVRAKRAPANRALLPHIPAAGKKFVIIPSAEP